MASKNMADSRAVVEQDIPDLDINLLATEEEKANAAKSEKPMEVEEKKDDRLKLPGKKKSRKINVSDKSSHAWLQRINTVQQKRITPAMRARMKRRATTQQRVKLNARKCKRMQKKTRANKNVWANSMQTMERSSVRNYEDVSRTAQSEMLMLRSEAIDQGDDYLSVAADRGPVQYNMLEVDQAVVLADAVAEQNEEAEAVGANEMERLLSQLRTEPNTDEERKAKFELYETYLETVCEIRKQTFAFWEECKPDFQQEARDNEGAAVKGIEKSLKELDSEEALGMPDFDGRIWFVYGMCQKAVANNDAIQGVLKIIRIKLELLSHQAECPICLEEFDNEHMPQLLSCCHKVCDVCWEHWKALRHGRVFCPLCRNDEFVEDVVNMHSNIAL